MIRNPLLRNREWLYTKYVVEGLSIDAIGKIIGCSDVTILEYLKRNGIEARKKGFNLKKISGKRPPENTGKKWSDAIKKKMSRSAHKRKISEEGREALRKRRNSMQGRLKENNPRWGSKHTLEARKKMSRNRKRANKLKGVGGKTKGNLKIRMSFEYKLWREAVFKRDDWTCVWCGVRGSYLQADHIKPFAFYPELRLAIDNGRTLCRDCHKKTDTYGGKALRKQKQYGK